MFRIDRTSRGWGRAILFAGLVLLLPLTGCENSSDDSSDSSSGDPGGSSRDIGSNDPNVLVALGDSVTGGEEISGPSYPEILSGLLGKTVVNEGRGGDLSSAGVSKINSVLARYKPSKALIMYGINDIIHVGNPDWTIGNLRTMIQACKANKTVPVLGTIPPRYRGESGWDARHTALNNSIRSLAREEGVALADVEKELGHNTAVFLDDGIHPNNDGTRIIAMAFYDAAR